MICGVVPEIHSSTIIGFSASDLSIICNLAPGSSSPVVISVFVISTWVSLSSIFTLSMVPSGETVNSISFA